MSINISYNRIWNIAYPIILGSVAQNLINVTDTAFLGRVGEIELGASALGGMFYLILFTVAMGFGTGTQIIISRRFGEGRTEQIGKTFDHAIYFMAPLAVASFLVMLWAADPILRYVVGSDQVYDASVRFVNYRMYGIFFAVGQILYRAFYIGIAQTQIITWSTLIMASVNIFLDYALIFGNFGFPEMGVEGAALASTLAEMITFVYLMLYVRYKRHHKEYGLYQFKKFNSQLFKRNSKLSVPIMVQNFFSFGVWFTFFLFVEKLGEQALAVSNIIRSVYIVLMIPIWGFASAANSMVSYLIGMKHPEKIFLLLRRIEIMAIAGVALLVTASMVFPRSILMIYTNDVNLIGQSISPLKVIGISAIFLASGNILFNGVMGTGKTNVSFLIEAVVLTVYVGYVFVVVHLLHANVTIAWTTEILYGIILTGLSYLYLKKGNWIKKSI